MKIEKNVVVSLAYQVKTEEGVVVDQSTAEAPLDYLHGHDNLIVGLEKALEGKVAGDKFSITVAPEEAYGEHMDEMIQRVPADVFQGVEQIEVGMRFLADTDQGPIPVEVTEVDGDEVVVDGNHMLAGQTLGFEVEVIAVRAATEEEATHGHVHQEGGCGHDHGHDHDHEGGCCGGEGHSHEHKEDHECCGSGNCSK
ncbi:MULTISPECIES: peptidylprolyl isomerase [Aliivibrio]|jgi:FKBP-type peptidyl-prolyl cis-trans isomerase SlyD|uniref:Peptidyl-prolyl cis-trans isomerase n=3 Tax=Aliivibrio TaxID=511678 RepID=A0A1B9NVC1_ALILO|nr:MULTISPECIES: peptidylprolyl isomerase [Aliivibrio]AZL83763.1 peptidylprolyl isomerase [Aliivibrio salmonicida]MBB1314976.1 peptidylprolyl isomerase [Aliivibrio sp. SR45-2]OCH18535.1 peptidylprolyl isomerase [Aliivibrio logei]OEF19834.1 peptidylprolyl isomerase [Aliivibrio logei 5S-186]CAQ77987.1 FKBP-type peptidyl-prolyl cis-trans isomerase SlyD [Aliivibrio salmonicida LFI1238]